MNSCVTKIADVEQVTKVQKSERDFRRQEELGLNIRETEDSEQEDRRDR